MSGISSIQNRPLTGKQAKKAGRGESSSNSTKVFSKLWQENTDQSVEASNGVSSVEAGAEGGSGSIENIAETNSALGLLSLQQTRKKDNFLYDHRKETSKKWGKEALGKLDEIRLAILSGRLPKDKLQQLAELSGQRKTEVDDEKLTNILQDIQTRALVELAKIEKAQQKQKTQKS